MIASLDAYDATPRALAKATDCLFVSVDYPMAPENKFPAAHEATWQAWRWITDNAVSFGGDGERFAVMGESAGGNLAVNIAIRARDEGGVQPAALIAVYPVASNDMSSESYVEQANAKPLNKAMMQWFVGHVFEDQSQTADPRLNSSPPICQVFRPRRSLTPNSIRCAATANVLPSSLRRRRRGRSQLL